MVTLILYSKPGCHLCEGLQEKLEQIQDPSMELEIRDITSREDWFQAYQYEIPVLIKRENLAADRAMETPLPRPAPRLSVEQLQRFLQKYL
ncbi:glutaredoxin family protein [Acaryochloris sp. 'Moss Beach']|uniref:glutaredoxin family protein n=1 Tax=Acaryochloris sp. 'Moss Beach' TaxID=2740837 RepID=UPI001F404D6A|nr:glutaredoxin family protein [Acaryochloris sp. 'Moss Beach']UJB70491.1 glutaredoxin family protein [Acaryochloris sp. 'Moss Beach']